MPNASWVQGKDQPAAFASSVGKPLIATETCWGATEDTKRVEIINYTLGQLKKRGIGWLVYLLHHSLIADAHRAEFGPLSAPGNLAFIEDYFYRPQGPGMTAFENELGGRVVVMGYAPWIFLHSVGKRLQLQNAADWISRNRMPVRVDETVPLVSVARVSADRQRGAVMLLNAGMDFIPEATVHVRLPVLQARLLAIGRDEGTFNIQLEATGGCFTLREIEPWGLRILLLGEV